MGVTSLRDPLQGTNPLSERGSFQPPGHPNDWLLIKPWPLKSKATLSRSKLERKPWTMLHYQPCFTNIWVGFPWAKRALYAPRKRHHPSIGAHSRELCWWGWPSWGSWGKTYGGVKGNKVVLKGDVPVRRGWLLCTRRQVAVNKWVLSATPESGLVFFPPS